MSTPSLKQMLTALASLLAAAAPSLITRITNQYPALGGVVSLALAILIALAWLLQWIQSHPSIRGRLLVETQRHRFQWALAALCGAILAILGATAIFYFDLNITLPVLSVPGWLPLRLVPDGAVFLIGTLLVGMIFYFRWRLMRIKADTCYAILAQIDDDRREGKFRYDLSTSIADTRKQGRILDYLARQPDFGVTRARGRFKLDGKARIWKDLDDREKAAADWMSHASQAQSAESPVTESPDVVREERLAELANEIWQSGGKDHYWQAAGRKVRRGRFSKIFGNRLDDLFNGGAGFRLYGPNGPRLLTMVIKGPPGAGKSTLALQISRTLARQGNFCMYYSLEEERRSLLQSAENFGWLKAKKVTWPARTVNYQGVVYVSETEAREALEARKKFVERVETGDEGKPGRQQKQKVSSALEPDVEDEVGSDGESVEPPKTDATSKSAESIDGIVLVSSLGKRTMTIGERMRKLGKVWGGRLDRTVDLPDFVRSVVIDSLEGFANVGLTQEGQIAVPRDGLLKLKEFFRNRCEMLIILTEDAGSGKASYVDFVADVVIQLGHRIEDDYTILFAEILKARNQSHALGQHQLKIRSVADIEGAQGALLEGLLRLKPGIVIFPTLHYRLWQSHRRPTYDNLILSTGIQGLDEMLDADTTRASQRRSSAARLGLRRKSSTAILGPTSTGKTLLALNFLVEGVRENTPTLLLSLRDDVGTITGRQVVQEHDRLRFSWREDLSLDGDEKIYHQFEWDLDGVARWVPPSRDVPQTRLPYLFQKAPVSYDARSTDKEVTDQIKAVTAFLQALADACPVEVSGKRRWDAAARLRLKAVYDAAWATFVDTEAGEDGHKQKIGDQLVRVLADNPDGSQTVAPKQIKLRNVTEDLGEDAPSPYLYWDSRKYDATTKRTMADTSLLKIMYWRPGNITPEEFVDRLIREIGEVDDSDQESRYERVVFDEVSQLRQRFPLLARSQLFLPTLIDTFKAVGMTSLFLADAEVETPFTLDPVLNHGLDVMTDHVIRTRIAYRIGSEQEGGPLTFDPPKEPGAANRAVIVEIDARPGVARQVPHLLRVNDVASFDPEADESERILEVEMDRLEPPAPPAQ